MTLTDDEVDTTTIRDVECPKSRQKPVTHTSVHRPLCAACAKMRTYFDLKCAGCREILYKDDTTIAQVFAILRQWNPETQQNIEFYVREILRRGAHADDRDSSTGMTLLHFAVKAGADGISDPRPASRAIKLLLSKGADVNARCSSTDMTAIQYAAFFNSPTLIDLLMSYNIEIDVHDASSVMDGASALHMSATTMSYDAAQCLLKYGADPRQKDKRGRSPLQCIPTVETGNQDAALLRDKLLRLLSCEGEYVTDPNSTVDVTSRHGGIQAGEEVIVGGIKRGWLRFVGPAQFAPGIWAGVELIDPIGKNNGTLNGVQYFTCEQNHGIFAPLSKVTKVRHKSSRKRSRARSASGATLGQGKVDITSVGSKVDTGRGKENTAATLYTLGDQVEMAGKRRGIIRFIGETHFASGIWYGIELTNTVGKNDGAINEIRYFTCESDRGIFAPPSRVRKVRSYKPEKSDKLPEKSRSRSRSAMIQSLAPGTGKRQEVMKPSKSVGDLSKRAFLQSRNRSLSNTSLASKSLSLAPSNSATGDMKLEKGLTVLCNNELGVIRYVGPVDFAEGLWLGVEFRKPSGKNDGTVDGKKYFVCRENYGIMVRPSKVSVRGINGAQLVENTSYIGEEIMFNSRF